jgi:hypothetical protein
METPSSGEWSISPVPVTNSPRSSHRDTVNELRRILNLLARPRLGGRGDRPSRHAQLVARSHMRWRDQPGQLPFRPVREFDPDREPASHRRDDATQGAEQDVATPLDPRHCGLLDPGTPGDLRLGELAEPPEFRESHGRGRLGPSTGPGDRRPLLRSDRSHRASSRSRPRRASRRRSQGRVSIRPRSRETPRRAEHRGARGPSHRPGDRSPSRGREIASPSRHVAPRSDSWPSSRSDGVPVGTRLVEDDVPGGMVDDLDCTVHFDLGAGWLAAR